VNAHYTYLYSGFACLALAILLVVYVAVAIPSVVAPSLGPRGRRRAQVHETSDLFRRFEPLIRKVAGWIAQGDVAARQRTVIDDLLRRSGFYLGVTPEEFLAIIAICGFLAGCVCVAAHWLVNLPLVLLPMAVIVGGFLPYWQLQEAAQERFKKINRGLPPAIDLVSLCLSAGPDFPSAISFVVDESEDEHDPVREEFVAILQQLEVGYTRANAMRNFAERVPTPAVRDFVGAVVQAEEKGNPLAEVLTIQARMLRMRRSVMAEEAAARAGVLMIGPLMVMLLAILIILFGPFSINGLGM
jgi:tight adherence protein C